MFISNSVKVVKAKSAKLLWCARVREGEGRDYTKNNSRFSHHNLEAIIKFTIFAISNKNPHHFFDGHSYLRVAFFSYYYERTCDILCRWFQFLLWTKV